MNKKQTARFEQLLAEPLTHERVLELKKLMVDTGAVWAARVADAVLRFATADVSERRAVVDAELAQAKEESARIFREAHITAERARVYAQSVVPPPAAAAQQCGPCTAVLDIAGNQARCKFCDERIWFVRRPGGHGWFVFDVYGDAHHTSACPRAS
jgi:uncharacterized protein with PIN domain